MDAPAPAREIIVEDVLTNQGAQLIRDSGDDHGGGGGSRGNGGNGNGVDAGSDAEATPRTAHAVLQSPGAVVSGEPFEITLGLSAVPTEGVFGEEMTIPNTVVGSYVLTIQLVADGFSLHPPEDSSGRTSRDWRLELAVTAHTPYPTVVVGLVADAQEEPIVARALQAVFSIAGQTIGLALRPIAVTLEPSNAPVATEEGGFDAVLPQGWVAPDLTVHVLRGRPEQEGRLLWTFETPHAGINPPHEELPCDIGDRPDAFALSLVRNMPQHEGSVDLYDYVAGIGNTVADHVPPEFWSLLSQVATRTAPAVPSVLLLSAEPHVPWELAVMESPLDPEMPPFLSVQARVGRWVLGRGRPKMPPPMSATADSLAVVSGIYDQPGWSRLLEAEAEAEELTQRYGAHAVSADIAAVRDCLKGTPPADVLHFSVHGKYDPTGAQNGLVLIDGRVLDPMVVRGNTFKAPRFVFLNACQVGMGDQLLGDYAGMAEAFLYAGAAGVVAPLWSIDDALARQLALDFYDETFSGTKPAELLRRRREGFHANRSPVSSTQIAYQFFGHPDMLLVRGFTDAAPAPA